MAGGWVEQRRYGPSQLQRRRGRDGVPRRGGPRHHAVAGVIGAPRDGRGLEDPAGRAGADLRQLRPVSRRGDRHPPRGPRRRPRHQRELRLRPVRGVPRASRRHELRVRRRRHGGRRVGQLPARPAMDPARQRPARADGQARTHSTSRPASPTRTSTPTCRRRASRSSRSRSELGRRGGRRRRRLLAMAQHRLRGADGERGGGVGHRREPAPVGRPDPPRSCAARPATWAGPVGHLDRVGRARPGCRRPRAGPLNDPFEPNDDIRWVDGSSGFRPDRPFLRTGAAGGGRGSASRRTRSTSTRSGSPGAARSRSA